MRIIPELARKIDREVRAKYEPRIKAIEKEIEIADNETCQAYLKEVKAIAKTSPHIMSLLRITEDDSEQDIMNNSRNNLCTLFRSPFKKEEKRKEIQELYRECEEEINTIKIHLTYSSDIKDITKIFQEHGLRF